MEWQPINTAPIHEDVLTYSNWGVVTAMRLYDGWTTGFEGVLDKAEVKYNFIPTHWMPLPQPPKV